jgi:Stress responsive A/B Barrel Domain
MLRHIVLLRWAGSATEEQKDRTTAAFRALPDQIPGIAALRCGPDLTLIDGNHDFAAVLDFADAKAWRTYQAHPAHLELIRTHVAPILAERAAVQFELEPADAG